MSPECRVEVEDKILQLNTFYSTLAKRRALREDHVCQKQCQVKPHGRLVLVSYAPYDASTPSLSNSSSTSGLQGACAPGDLILRQASRLDAFSDYPNRT